MLRSPNSTYFQIFKGRKKLRKDYRGLPYIVISKNHNVCLNLWNGLVDLKMFIGMWNHKGCEIFYVYYSVDLLEN
jgi:hypothetical protein